MRREAIMAVAAIAALGLVPYAAPGHAQSDPAACADLAALRIENAPGRFDTNLLSAAVVPAGEDLPAYCRVLGYVRPAINFEVRLPLDWNGKFYMAGCGGFCGTVDAERAGFINAVNPGLERGYAVSTMDSGHWGANVTDARWAHDNRIAEVDWGSRAVHETAKVTKALIAAFYGEPPARSYFQGCSTGGRMAAMEAQRFPDDFDGIIAGAPALDYTGLVATFFAWLVQANTGPDGEDILGPDVPGLVGPAALEACDTADGLEDGLIQDPRACDFDPASLQCAGEDAKGCLSAAEVATLEKWYGGAKNAAGEQLYPGGIPVGSEPYWWLWLTGDGEGNGRLIPPFNDNFLKYMAFAEDPGHGYGPLDFDFERDPARLDVMAEIYNATDPDLGAFADAGGKLLMWHGWADAIVTPQLTVDYFEALEDAMGGRRATRDVARLFMVPGMDHCGLLPGGPGISQAGFDPLSALERWVEDGEAPERLLATKTDADGEGLWTRPLCPYPEVARYQGSGSIDEAENFACVLPSR